MFSDICFFHNKQYKVSLYPSLDYISDVIEESVVQTSSLKGLRQLSITRREEGKTKQIIVIYNYRYTNSTDSFGVCLVFNDYYPCGVNYLFSYFGEVIANIIKEGKLLFLDKKSGTIHATNQELTNHSAVIKRHIDRFKTYFRNGKAELVKISNLSSNYYSIFKKQTIVNQLSDTSWNITESLNYNNIVIITEEIEDENINNIRSIIKESNETIDNLNKQICKLNEQLKQAEKEKKKLRTKVNPSPKVEVKISSDVTMWIVLGIIVVVIHLNLIAPWFIPTIWSKLAVVFTGLGTIFLYISLENDPNKKIYEILGWIGIIAMLLSTVLTIYGLFGGFSEVEDTKGNTSVSFITDKDSTIINSQALRFPFPKDFVQIPGGIFNKYSGSENRTIIESLVDSFYIGKYEVLQKDYERVMGLNPSRFKGDSIPVHGMSVHDAVLFCNKISNENGYDGFYEINDKTVTIKENGNGYRLPTEEEWILASRKLGASKIANHIYANSKTNIENVILEPHIVGGKKTDGQLLYDMFGNICELCIRSNGEIWGKGGSYQNRLQSENNEKAGFRAADNISSTKKLKDIFGLRLVFIPKNL